MTINFRTRKLKKLLDSDNALQRGYGQQGAKRVKARMALLLGAGSLHQVPRQSPERLHQLKGRRKEEFAVDLGPRLRLTFVPDHDPVPRYQDGGIDLKRVTAITIRNIEDYH
ncbi:MAG: system killer suppression protein [Bacteroidota bacterium]|nr:system killer suppression protein [Bacteroidota bacterium]MDE2957478.1 system killer suppression protein [Bacteroidota bacterium]